MKTSCSACTRHATSQGQVPHVFDADEINQETGLCMSVCDMVRECEEIDNDADAYYAEDY
jgi:hypothetical protein